MINWFIYLNDTINYLCAFYIFIFYCDYVWSLICEAASFRAGYELKTIVVVGCNFFRSFIFFRFISFCSLLSRENFKVRVRKESQSKIEIKYSIHFLVFIWNVRQIIQIIVNEILVLSVIAEVRSDRWLLYVQFIRLLLFFFQNFCCFGLRSKWKWMNMNIDMDRRCVLSVWL